MKYGKAADDEEIRIEECGESTVASFFGVRLTGMMVHLRFGVFA
jgi:hypothetical protein